jgi:hypothetical protein
VQQVAIEETSRRAPSRTETLSTLRVPMWIAAAYVLLSTKADPDLFGHLRFGLDLLRSGHLSSTDPYSFTADMPWTNHEWLSEIAMALACSVGGAGGLIVLKDLVTVATIAVILRAVSDSSPLWRWPGGLLAVLGMMPISLTMRPQIWTLLFLTVTCAILTGPWKRRWGLPLIFLAWANMHGGWLVGIGVLAAWSGVELFESDSDRPPLPVVVLVPIACLLVTLVNPYGWHLWEFLANTVRLTREDISEWQPLWRASAGSIIHWLAGFVWAGLAVRYAERKSLKAIAATAVLAYASMRVLRLVPLFLPAAVILLVPFVRRREAGEHHVWSHAKTLIDLTCAGVGLAIVAWPLSPGCIHMRGPWVPDANATRAISAAHLSGRMVTFFDWGEYAIWHFGPDLRVSIDGRRETVYSQRVLDQQLKVAYGDPVALAQLQAASPEYAWLPQGHTGRAKPWFASHGYRIDIDTPLSFVAVRKDLPRVPPVAAGPAPCFPGI